MKHLLLLPAACILVGCSMVFSNDPYDLYVKTSVTGVPTNEIYYRGDVLPAGKQATVEDYCYVEDPATATATGTQLKEFILENGKLNFGDRDCSCSDGACARPRAVTACEDSDGGEDIYTAGTIVGIYKDEDFVSEASDDCNDSAIYKTDEETGESIRTGEFSQGKNVLEMRCTDGMTYDYEWIPCEFGCLKGACLRAATKQ